jgi:NADPH-dependent curcumin reductase CurA
MTAFLARQIVLAARPQGKPRLSDFRLEETEIPTPASGQLLLAVQHLSLDPYMRGRMDDRKSCANPLQLGDVMTGESVARVLASAPACPSGIDVYFENVGGAVWQAVLPLLNTYARIPVSGLIAQYNGVGSGDGTDRLPATMREILSKSLTLRGFINFEFAGQCYDEFLRDVGAGIADGRIRYREDIIDGLDKAPEAFIGMLDGRNFGKLIVRVGAD